MLKQLLTDTRQGAVGWLVGAVLTAVSTAVVAAGLFGGQVPLWLLGVVALVLFGVGSLLVWGQARRRLQLEGQLQEAHKRLSALDKSTMELREQLQAAVEGETPMSDRAQGFIRRIEALREGTSQGLSSGAKTYTTLPERDLVVVLIRDMEDAFGNDRALETARAVWSSFDNTNDTIKNLLTTLAQLRAVAMNYGVCDLKSVPPPDASPERN